MKKTSKNLEECRAVNEKYREIIEGANQVIVEVSRDGVILFANSFAADILKKKREDVVGKTMWEIFPEDVADRQVSSVQKVIDSGTKMVFVNRSDVDGRKVWYESTVQPMKHNENDTPSAIVFAVDVTSRKKVEEDRERQWDLLKSVINNIPMFVFWKDTDSVYLGCNKEFARVSGVGKPEDIVGKTDHDMAWKKEEADFFVKIDKEVMLDNKPMLNIEEPQLQADGKEAILLTSKVPLRDNDGKVTGILGIYTDITERKKAETRLNLFRTLVNQSIDEIFLVDAATGMFLDANDQACRTLGYKREELLKMKVSDVESLFPEESSWTKHVEDVKNSTGLVIIGEHKKKNEEVFPVEVNVKHVEIDGKGYIVAVARDITERKKFEERLMESETRYRTIFDNTGSVMVIIEDDMKISMVNSEFEKFFGFTKSEAEGKMKLTDIICEEEHEKVESYHRLRRIDQDAAPRNYQLKVVDRGGKVSEAYVTVAIITGTGKTVVSVLDVTELKRNEFELQRQRDLLNNINKALEHKINELSEAMKHIKKLEGLVPICSSCKKMMKSGDDPRNPKSWISLEKYISDRTDASFTHGLCPECINRLYGDIIDKKRGE
jgi:PAS domain S-box-containing protein